MQLTVTPGQTLCSRAKRSRPPHSHVTGHSISQSKSDIGVKLGRIREFNRPVFISESLLSIGNISGGPTVPRRVTFAMTESICGPTRPSPIRSHRM